jgi:hypothetical protein
METEWFTDYFCGKLMGVDQALSARLKPAHNSFPLLYTLCTSLLTHISVKSTACRYLLCYKLNTMRILPDT